ncbi:keratin-associated protein 5-6-like [Ostrea edulis]|uniref:keratin-associated protein 5-6-like n=1 Tax=Ostrea edulis TaxID=37623 RepID=UPI0024AFDF09|nr:keratin-associated protein 5-6-like [Ostrea edulis]
MSDCGDMGDCDCGDCDCGDCGDCGDCCECGKCECDNCFTCGCCDGCGGDDGCCGSDSNCFICGCCDGCRGDDGCCGSDSVDNNSLDGHGVHGRGCSWSFCFIVTDDDCCDNGDSRRRRNQRRYELERRRQMETQGPSVVNTVNGAPDSQLPTTDSVLPSDQEPNIDNMEQPTTITTQPPSYEEATQGEPVVTSQPVSSV